MGERGRARLPPSRPSRLGGSLALPVVLQREALAGPPSPGRYRCIHGKIGWNRRRKKETAMSALAEAIAQLKLEPGETYRATVDGYEVEVRRLDKAPRPEPAEEPSQFADMVMLEPW